MNNAYGVFRGFWDRAVRNRGMRLGPDENLTFDVSTRIGDVGDDGFVIDAWWVKGYGKHAPFRHSRRRIETRELYSKERVFETLYNVAEELVLELFPVLPRSGRWRLFSRRPRCKA
jgi:hypothetical protein